MSVGRRSGREFPGTGDRKDGEAVMDTRYVATFRKVAALGGFTRAAEQLGYTQSTVSTQIQALEEEVGLPLFERSGRRVLLTSAGKRFLRYAEEMMALEERIRNMAGEEGKIHGELAIAAGESVTVYRLNGVLETYRRSFPGVSLSLRNSQCPIMIDWLRRGETDLVVLISQPVRLPDLEVVTLVEEPMLFVAAAGADEDLLERALAARRLDACLIVTEQGCSYRLFMEHFFRERGILPDKQMEFWSMEAIKRCVESGLGISFLPRMAVREELASGRMVALRCDAELERFVTQIAWRRNGWMSPAAKEFARICIDAAREWQ